MSASRSMGHSHAGHSHAPASFGRAFAVGVALNTLYVVVEAAYGLLSGSLALVADAGHNLSDVFGLLLAWGAAYLGTRPPTARRTYGLRRSSVLAAMFNAVFLLVAIGAIAWEAIRRFERPEPVAGGTVMVVAAVGIAVNALTAMMFAKGQKGDINVRGAFLHMAADALVSLAVVGAGFAMRLTGKAWIDPATSLIVVAVIGVGTWGLLRQSFDLALDAVPEEIDPAQVKDYLSGVEGVTNVHDLHIWAMSTTETALTVHLVRPGGVDDAALRAIGDELHERFGIEHPTIQVERGGHGECPMAPDEVV